MGETSRQGLSVPDPYSSSPPITPLPPSLPPSQSQAVCFDVDSTVCAEEGIDVLAEFLGQGQAVADLTAK